MRFWCCSYEQRTPPFSPRVGDCANLSISTSCVPLQGRFYFPEVNAVITSCVVHKPMCLGHQVYGGCIWGPTYYYYSCSFYFAMSTLYNPLVSFQTRDGTRSLCWYGNIGTTRPQSRICLWYHGKHREAKVDEKSTTKVRTWGYLAFPVCLKSILVPNIHASMATHINNVPHMDNFFQHNRAQD